MLGKTVNKTSKNPKIIFVFDGFGALLSSILLGCVLTRFENVFGISKSTLYFLALIPVFFIIYDILGYIRAPKKTELWLKGIAFLNSSYCLLSIFFAIKSKTITLFGSLYIVVEITIILLLVIIEFKVSQKIKQQKTS